MDAKARKGGLLHTKLRERMKAWGISGKTMAKKLQCCDATFSDRMTGRSPWLSWEMHTIMEILEIPAQQMYEFFPPHGVDVPPLKDTRLEDYLEERNEVAVARPVLDALFDLMHGLRRCGA